MDRRPDATYCFDHAPLVAPDPPPPRALPGFHRSDTSVFYVTMDGRVYVLRTSDEPACLHPCRMLPATALPASAQVEPALEILARAADELGMPASVRMRSIRAEVRRDRMLAVTALLQETLACVSEELGSLLLDERPPDPSGLHERMADRLAALDRQRRSLDDHRIICRGERANVPPPTPDVPTAAAPFRHRGEYVGSFIGLDAAGKTLSSSLPDQTAAAATSIRDAHLRGELWTMARDGLVYVFHCPPTSTNNAHTSKAT